MVNSSSFLLHHRLYIWVIHGQFCILFGKFLEKGKDLLCVPRVFTKSWGESFITVVLIASYLGDEFLRLLIMLLTSFLFILALSTLSGHGDFIKGEMS